MGEKIKNKFGEVWGYVRVSTKEQHEDRQLDALEDYGVEPSHIFVDKQSGKNLNRPAYKKLIRVVRKGDIIVIKSIDRLGRNYTDIIDQWRMITGDIGCGIHVIDVPMLNTSGDPGDPVSKLISDLMLQVLSFVAQNEREQTLARQREGIDAAAKRRRVKIGRPKKKMPFDFWEIYIMWKSHEYNTNDLWRYCHETWGMANRTFFRRIHELDVRFGDLDPQRLRDLVFDEEMYDGIEYSNERLEQAMGYYNPYSLFNPKKDADRRKAARDNKDRTEEQLRQEDKEIQEMILAKRRQQFNERFGIIDPNAGPTVEYSGGTKKKSLKTTEKENERPNMNNFQHVITNHKKKSGFDEAVSTGVIEDEEARAKEALNNDDEGPSGPMKTIIIT